MRSFSLGENRKINGKLFIQFYIFILGKFQQTSPTWCQESNWKKKSWTNLLFLCLVCSCCCSEHLYSSFLNHWDIFNLVGDILYKCTQFKSVGRGMTFSQSFIHSNPMGDKCRFYTWEETDTSIVMQSIWYPRDCQWALYALKKKWLSWPIMTNRTYIWYKNWPDILGMRKLMYFFF